VNDVHARVEFTTQSNHQLNRLILSRPRPRLEKRAIITRRKIRRLNRTRQLSMHDQKGIESRQLRHRFAQVLLRYILKLINTRRHQKTLKPNHTRCEHRRQLGRISRHDTAPKSHIYKTIVTRLVQLRFEARERSSRRYGVEWHVDQRRDAARSGSERRAVKALPLSSSGRVDVNVRIDESRHHDRLIGHFNDLPVNVDVSRNVNNAPITNMDRTWTNFVRQHYSLRANDHQLKTGGGGGKSGANSRGCAKPNTCS
jgi:hypothetical protein